MRIEGRLQRLEEVLGSAPVGVGVGAALRDEVKALLPDHPWLRPAVDGTSGIVEIPTGADLGAVDSAALYAFRRAVGIVGMLIFIPERRRHDGS